MSRYRRTTAGPKTVGQAPAFVTADEQGARQRHCRDMGEGAFFDHVTSADVARARDICAGCPLLDACGDYALDPSVRGFWAGTTERERLAQRRRLRETQVAA